LHLSSLALSNFRNYKEMRVRFSPGLNVIYGQNAQGKTNLLEAIYMLATGKSPRTNRDQELIMEGESAASARAAVTRKTGDLSVELLFGLETRKQVKLNGIAEKKIANLIGNLAAVLFSPDDLQLLKGSPSGRRRFLDIELSQLSQTYLHHLIVYNRTLSQRNTLLKQEKVDQALLAVYDEQLLDSGPQIILRRHEAVQRLRLLAAKYHHLVAEGKETLCIEYQSQGIENDPTPSLSVITQRLRDLMGQRRHEEIRRSVTLVGPHRDDLLFTINERDARFYGSQGQQRTAVLALKLAELEFMFEELGEYPVLLLDDVASELDPNRRNYLLRAVQEGVQTFVSCTDLEDLMVRTWPAEHRLFRVQSGQIEVDQKGLV
jgi:DNA replication and repair protein RecF